MLKGPVVIMVKRHGIDCEDKKKRKEKIILIVKTEDLGH